MKLSEDYSKMEVAKEVAHARFSGFSGEFCACNAAANVIIGVPPWLCPCGQWNDMNLYDHRTPHDNPKYGPPESMILSAISEAK